MSKDIYIKIWGYKPQETKELEEFKQYLLKLIATTDIKYINFASLSFELDNIKYR